MKSIAFSCIVDRPRYLMAQCFVWVNCLLEIQKVPPESIFVHVTAVADPEFLPLVESLGVNVVRVTSFDLRSPHCNKIWQLKTFADRNFEMPLVMEALAGHLQGGSYGRAENTPTRAAQRCELMDIASEMGIVASASCDSYRFTHTLIRESLYEGSTQTDRTRLHRVVGQALEQMHAANLTPHLAALRISSERPASSTKQLTTRYARAKRPRSTAVMALVSAGSIEWRRTGIPAFLAYALPVTTGPICRSSTKKVSTRQLLPKKKGRRNFGRVAGCDSSRCCLLVPAKVYRRSRPTVGASRIWSTRSNAPKPRMTRACWLALGPRKRLYHRKSHLAQDF